MYAGTANGSTSELSYKPQSERDYGTLSCRGTNTVGRQLDPCVFQIVPAGESLLILDYSESKDHVLLLFLLVGC